MGPKNVKMYRIFTKFRDINASHPLHDFYEIFRNCVALYKTISRPHLCMILLRFLFQQSYTDIIIFLTLLN